MCTRSITTQKKRNENRGLSNLSLHTLSVAALPGHYEVRGIKWRRASKRRHLNHKRREIHIKHLEDICGRRDIIYIYGERGERMKGSGWKVWRGNWCRFNYYPSQVSNKWAWDEQNRIYIAFNTKQKTPRVISGTKSYEINNTYVLHTKPHYNKNPAPHIIWQTICDELNAKMQIYLYSWFNCDVSRKSKTTTVDHIS